ncbi:N-acetyltransferase domain-containing protein [Penicillium ucsense]|uniref:N-acetyltransferase domain-containing protein n=1 Tax=Penicillium ucsense TaxID=2839758 RepID=A0A8J8WGR7_9EURO|nr:N-acetyltransferase domain-containing protein [Penicillium ucsense]KAF7734632.1 N-acetyltransferase domain-containing protein [Penicillium ucsense]
MVLRYRSSNGEPYLRLPEPHTNIIITPHRPEGMDETSAALTQMLNDPAIALNLQNTPYPYTRSHAEDWIKANLEEQQHMLAALREELDQQSMKASASEVGNERTIHKSPAQIVDFCPFTCIREVVESENGNEGPFKDVLIGDIRLARSSFEDFPETGPEREHAKKMNDDLSAGDPSIIWSFGDFLSPTHQGMGIMTLAIQTIIHDWAVPRMNVHRLRCWAFEDNTGSIRVFEKNGFVRGHTLKDWASVSESRGGGKKSIVSLEWTRYT